MQPLVQVYLQEPEDMVLANLSMALHVQIGHIRFRQVLSMSADGPGGSPVQTYLLALPEEDVVLLSLSEAVQQPSLMGCATAHFADCGQ